MATLSEQVSLLIDGHAHTRWERYRVEASMLTPADAWELSIWGEPQQQLLPDYVRAGAPMKLLIGGETVLTGMVDSVEHTVSKTSHSVTMNGRDAGAALVDCSVPMLAMQNATLAQIIQKAVAPFGITKINQQVKPSAPMQKIHTEPGQTVWEWLQAGCEANQVWPWFAPDGTLVIGQPDYTTPPVATLLMRTEDGTGSAKANNVKHLERHKSVHGRYTAVTVLGQAAGDGTNDGQYAVSSTVTDDDLLAQFPALYRPKVVLDGNAATTALATARAHKLMGDAMMHSERLHVTLAGHRVLPSNALWQTGVRVHVVSDPHGIDAIYFVIKRVFDMTQMGGTQTYLELIPDGSWILNIPLVKGKRRNNTGKRNLTYVQPTSSNGAQP